MDVHVVTAEPVPTTTTLPSPPPVAEVVIDEPTLFPSPNAQGEVEIPQIVVSAASKADSPPQSPPSSTPCVDVADVNIGADTEATSTTSQAIISEDEVPLVIGIAPEVTVAPEDTNSSLTTITEEDPDLSVLCVRDLPTRYQLPPPPATPDCEIIPSPSPTIDLTAPSTAPPTIDLSDVLPPPNRSTPAPTSHPVVIKLDDDDDPTPRIKTLPSHPSLYSVPAWRSPHAYTPYDEYDVDDIASIKKAAHSSRGGRPRHHRHPSKPIDPFSPSSGGGVRKKRWSKSMYVDLALHLQKAFPFTDFCAKHGVAHKEVFDVFAAVVHMPLLEHSNTAAGAAGVVSGSGGGGVEGPVAQRPGGVVFGPEDRLRTFRNRERDLKTIRNAEGLMEKMVAKEKGKDKEKGFGDE